MQNSELKQLLKEHYQLISIEKRLFTDPLVVANRHKLDIEIAKVEV